MAKCWLLPLCLLTVSCSRQPEIASTVDIALSIKSGNIDLLKAAYRKDPSGKFENDETTNLLEVAVKYRNENAVEVLLIHGADPDGSKREWDTPLRMAVADGNVEAVRMLVDYLADPDLSVPLEVLDFDKHGEELYPILARAGADPNKKGKYPGCLLSRSVTDGMKHVQALLEMGADPDGIGSDTGEPIRLARGMKRQDIVELLLRYGAQDRSALKSYPFYRNTGLSIEQMLEAKGAKDGR